MLRVSSDFLVPFSRCAGFANINGMEKEEDCENEGRPGGNRMSEAEIDYNLMESFPASDPPSWTLGVRPRKTTSEEFEGETLSPNFPSHQNEPPE
jgi:hypothetical protein